MSTRTYRASTLKEVLAQVRRDLGGQAVILGTREVRRRRMFGFGTRELVEVVASDGLNGPVEVEMPTASESPNARSVEERSKASQSQIERIVPAHSPLSLQFGVKLSQLHAMVENLSKNGRVDHLLLDLPAELVPSYSRLIEAEVPEAFAHKLLRQVMKRLEPSEVLRLEAVRETLREVVEDSIQVAPPPTAVPGIRKVLALVGPTGVGKTTTVAKLAANFKLIQGFRPGLVTVDTYRIAAIEQLRTYAEIIALPLVVANTPREMRRAIDQLGDVDIVLIDTAGRSPRDEVKIRELSEFLTEARPDEVHLVLSAGVSERSLFAAIDRFSAVQVDRLIFTKLDEASGLGSLLAVLGYADKPVSYITTGQAVPDDIEPANRVRLARLILGEEIVHESN